MRKGRLPVPPGAGGGGGGGGVSWRRRRGGWGRAPVASSGRPGPRPVCRAGAPAVWAPWRPRPRRGARSRWSISRRTPTRRTSISTRRTPTPTAFTRTLSWTCGTCVLSSSVESPSPWCWARSSLPICLTIGELGPGPLSPSTPRSLGPQPAPDLLLTGRCPPPPSPSLRPWGGEGKLAHVGVWRPALLPCHFGEGEVGGFR